MTNLRTITADLPHDIRFLAICSPFMGAPRKRNRILVSRNGTVRVYDSVAEHYTTCHTLSPAEQERLCRKAVKVAREAR